MIVDENILLEYFDILQPLYDGKLGELQKEALMKRYPIVRPETAKFMGVILSLKKPKNVLEIGCAVGFSAGLFSRYLQEGGKVTTIERFDVMIDEAKKNFKKLGIEDKVTLLEGNAIDILPTLKKGYDCIFIDAAKGQYLQFLPYCMDLLDKGGILIADDVLQGGTVALERQQIERRQRTTHRKMRAFLHLISNTKGLESSVVPIGDGLAIVLKTEEKIEFEKIDLEDF